MAYPINPSLWQLIIKRNKLACLLLSAIFKARDTHNIRRNDTRHWQNYVMQSVVYAVNKTFISSAFINVVHYFQPRLMFASKAQALPTDIDQNGSSRHTSLQYQGVDYYCKMIYSIGY